MKSWIKRCWAIASFCCDGYLRICLAAVVCLVVAYLTIAVGSILIANTIDAQLPEEVATQVVQDVAGVTVSSDGWQKLQLPGTSSVFRGNDFLLTYSKEDDASIRVRVHKVMGRGWEMASYADLRK